MQLDPWVPLLETDITEHKRSEPENPTPHYTDRQTGQGHIQDRLDHRSETPGHCVPNYSLPFILCLSSDKDRGSGKKAVDNSLNTWTPSPDKNVAFYQDGSEQKQFLSSSSKKGFAVLISLQSSTPEPPFPGVPQPPTQPGSTSSVQLPTPEEGGRGCDSVGKGSCYI